MCVTSVIIRTITPVFTGGAHREHDGLKPQSILGSLRFWFEVYCYAIGKLGKDCCEEIDNAEFTKILRDVIIQNNNISLAEAKKETLKKLKVSLPSQFFGCNGWEGFLKIKEIKIGNVQNIELPNNIYKDKNNLNAPWYENKFNLNRKICHAWYFPEEYFFGDFEIEFLLSDENLKEEFLYPLLHFVERYGFIGAKNNIGFGRVRVLLENDELSLYKSFNLNNEVKDINDAVEVIDVREITEEQKLERFNNLFNGSTGGRKVKLLKIEEIVEEKEDNHKYFIEIIERLIRVKSQKRCEFRTNTERRHYIFGSTKKDKYKNIEGPNATKIIPWIDKAGKNKYETGFISLVLLENFPRGWGEKIE